MPSPTRADTVSVLVDIGVILRIAVGGVREPRHIGGMDGGLPLFSRQLSAAALVLADGAVGQGAGNAVDDDGLHDGEPPTLGRVPALDFLYYSTKRREKQGKNYMLDI